MVFVQHFTPTHWSARAAGDMVLGGFCISPLHFYLVLHSCSFPYQCFFSTVKCICLFCHFHSIHLSFTSHFVLIINFVNEMGGFPSVVLKIMLALCGLWNLDLFHPIVPPFCVSPNLTNLHAFALEYIEAFYPLILILLTYICIKLHDHNFVPVVLLWKPFHRFFVYFRRNWDYQASVINAFATFFLLSFSTILFVTFIVTYHISPYALYSNGTFLKHMPLVLYYDPTVEYFSKDHLTFVYGSFCVTLLLILIPTLLLILYPIRIFRKCITCCRFRRWHALHIFMEAFQGH